MNIYSENDNKNQETLRNLETNTKETSSKIIQQAEELQMLKKKIPLTEKSLKDAVKELEITNGKESQLMDSIHRERMQLEEMKSSMNSVRSRNKVLDALLEQKRNGNCPGLYGRLVIKFCVFIPFFLVTAKFLILCRAIWEP